LEIFIKNSCLKERILTKIRKIFDYSKTKIKEKKVKSLTCL
jgi:hypothetical protein